jgi:hypothetical protein
MYMSLFLICKKSEAGILANGQLSTIQEFRHPGSFHVVALQFPRTYHLYLLVEDE